MRVPSRFPSLIPLCGLLLPAVLSAQITQRVEGFGEVVFAHNLDRIRPSMDFRGIAPGFATAGWWAPGQIKDNRLEWRTAVCPKQAPTVFAFIGASSATPPEFSQGPRANLFVNGKKALTFELGVSRDRIWRDGAYELRYSSRRVEWPYWGTHRQFEMNGDSGVYELSVPSSDIRAGSAVTLKVEPVPFPAWPRAWFMVKNRTDADLDDAQALREQVRQLQRDMVRMGELTEILATQQYNKLVDSRDFEHSVVYTNGYRHLHPADLISLKNGDLLLTTREATEHIAPDGDVIMLRSRDGGKTWGQKQVVGRRPDLDEREGCGLQLRDGSILMAVFYNSLYRPDGSYEYAWESKVKFGAGKQHLGTYTIKSTDNGFTWSEPSFIETKGMPFSDTEGPADAPVEMPDGSILMPVMGYNVRGDIKNQAAVLLKSTDQGKTWTNWSTIAEDPGNRMGHFQEPAIVLTKSGRLIAAMRNDGPAKAIWTNYSDDQGKTWSTPKESPMVGHPADLIQLSDGRILCTYGIRPGSHGDPGGIRATFSTDNGMSWDIANEVRIRRDFLNMDIGYPESMQVADGRILTVYYFNLFGRFFIGSSFWRP
jgi:sialidase-1